MVGHISVYLSRHLLLTECCVSIQMLTRKVKLNLPKSEIMVSPSNNSFTVIIPILQNGSTIQPVSEVILDISPFCTFLFPYSVKLQVLSILQNISQIHPQPLFWFSHSSSFSWTLYWPLESLPVNWKLTMYPF